MAAFHTITPMQWRDGSFGERLGLEIVSVVLWSLTHDERMTVLLTTLGSQITQTVESEEQVEAIIDMLRMQMKLSLAAARAG